MNTHALARRLLDLNTWLESLEGRDLERHEFNRAPLGRAGVTLDPTSTAPAASMNRNRISLCGAEGGLTRDGLAELAAMFTARGIPRFFVWLSPGPGDGEVREWLRSMSFARVMKRGRWSASKSISSLPITGLSKSTTQERRTKL